MVVESENTSPFTSILVLMRVPLVLQLSPGCPSGSNSLGAHNQNVTSPDGTGWPGKMSTNASSLTGVPGCNVTSCGSPFVSENENCF